MDSNLLNTSLNTLLPQSTYWNLEISYYNYSGGFILAGNLSAGTPLNEAERLVSSQREFLIFENNAIKHYGIARLKVWTG